VLVVHSHPRPESFVAAARDRARAGLVRAGHDVDTLDLDAEHFDPCLSAEERASHRVGGPRPTLTPDVRSHADRLRHADALVLVYPTWWGGQPAIMKGWLDRVWVNSVAYDDSPAGGRPRPRLRRIRHLVVITTHGSPKRVNAIEGEPGKRVVLRQLRACCHPLVRTRWLAIYGIDGSDEARRLAFLDRIDRAMVRL
jgi:NAD(P)H dehydrogenase (quinone)